ncbi:MAG: hypothetical protein RL328_2006 [Acidobacteriota bacterium]|jgi:glycosyltransferase involved in cell wall biosynthesis
MKTCLVVPCYNEAERFPQDVFLSFLASHPNVSLILANDGSRDGTAEMLRSVQAKAPGQVHLLDRAVNKGKAETVREGMLHALSLPERPDTIGFWDADLATPLSALHDMFPILEARPEIQMIFGARVNLLGWHIRRQAIRHYLGRVFATAVSVMLGLGIYDTQCGAKLFRVGPHTQGLFAEPFSSRWVFDVEIIARWIRANKFDREKVKTTIYECPLRVWEDVAGSKVKPYDFIKAFLDVLRIYQRYF